MDMSVLSAGLAWAMPVRPDDLGSHLKAYKKCLPALSALRLCNRYGKGPTAHITKLPVELLQEIDGHVFQHVLHGVTGDWKWVFRHFESRCEPLDHAEDPTVMCDVKEDFEDLCDKCHDDAGTNCEVCDPKVEEYMNECMMENIAWRFDTCQPLRDEWEAKIDQRPNGRFVKYDELLLKHFGLEAFFATTRTIMDSGAPWLDDPNHKWHWPAEELRTTICYLTLPKKTARKKEFPCSDMEIESVSAHIEGTQSSFVQLPTIADKDQRKAQFQRALRLLKLEPYIHPSQLGETITAEAKPASHESAEAAGDNQETNEGEVQDAAEMEWPQLIMLVKSLASCVA